MTGSEFEAGSWFDPTSRPRPRGFARWLALLTLAPQLSGCTLWDVFSPELLPLGPPSWQSAKEHADVTGERRVRIVSTMVAPQFAALSVRGQVEVQVELAPWTRYQGIQTYERSVESIFTHGRIRRVLQFTDPPGHERSPEPSAVDFDDTDFRARPRPPRRTRGKFWAAAPEQPPPRAAVSWRLYDTREIHGRITVGDTLGLGTVTSTGTGRFEIVLSSSLLRTAARMSGEEKHLYLTVEGDLAPVILTIPRDTCVKITRELDG